MNRNILITIEYDGTDYSGWQRQPDQRTVQGILEEALSKVCDMPISIDGVSRTDAGVHALGQRATFAGDFGIPTDRIMLAVNNLLAGGAIASTKDGDVRIIDVKEVPAGFHARFDAVGKKYRYKIRNTQDMPVFLRNYRYHVRTPLDVEKMNEAAALLKGSHDFACFQAAGGNPRLTTVRTITDISVFQATDGDVVLEVSGDGFLYNMVRIITGTLVEVGQGKIAPEKMNEILDSGDRQLAGHTAPPQGLYLVEVYYK